MATLQSIVAIVEGEPLASTEVIAKGMGQQHASVIKLVRRHGDRLARYGRVGFEIRSFETAGGTQHREFAMLNERQAMLLLTMMRNSQKVLDFKTNLVDEFCRMRDALQQIRHSVWQQMHALLAHEAESKSRASFGSHLMHVRKGEIQPIEDERKRLDELIQPPLFSLAPSTVQ
jgi:phage regulator Rha-like protein